MLNEQRPSALRFADPKVQAIWNTLLVFDRLPNGFSNRNLRSNLAALRGQPVEQFTQGRMTYQFASAPPAWPDRMNSPDPPLPAH
jgi:hypothetical protein